MDDFQRKTQSNSRRTIVAMGCTAIALIAGCAAPTKVQTGEDALLLVSLHDGSVVEQRIHADADICMKSNESTVTTCFKRGEPVLDTSGNAIIGYRMERTEIELVGR